MQLFISYSRTDIDFVKNLDFMLRSVANQHVWFDQKLVGGDHWWPTIIEQIEQCDCFIIVISPNCLASIFCQAELHYAIALNKPILPLVHIQAELPPELRALQFEKVAGLSSEAILARIQSALENIERERQNGEYPSPAATPAHPKEPQVPQTAYEMYVLGEEAAAIGNLNLAEVWFNRTEEADPDGYGRQVDKRLTAIKREKERRLAYEAIERLDKAGNIDGAKLAWRQYLADFGAEYDPQGLRRKYKASRLPIQVAGLILTLVLIAGIGSLIRAATSSATSTPTQNTVTSSPSSTVAATSISSNSGCASVVVVPVTSLSNKDDVQPVPAFWLQSPIPNAKILQVFGAQEEYYKRFGLPGHEGIDFQAVNGTTMLAAQSGIVSRVDPAAGSNSASEPYGNQIRIIHDWFGTEYITIYANLDSILVTEGQFVSAGQAIGRAGNTGNSMAAHLHLGLKQTGATQAKTTNFPADYIDPGPFLANPQTAFNYAALSSIPATNQFHSKSNETFCVRWTIRNMSSKTWTDYSVAPHSGVLPGQIVSLPVLKPGETTEITLTLKSPNRGGSFTGYWMLQDEKKIFFPSVFSISVAVP